MGITVQPKEDIIEILEQSKFGRPARVQHAIQRCIDEITDPNHTIPSDECEHDWIPCDRESESEFDKCSICGAKR